MRCSVGAILDVAVDLRRSSPSYGQWVGAELSAENHQQLWVPVGFAHGFLTLSELAEVQYKASGFWNRDCERSLRWDDPALAITWPLQRAGVQEPLLAAKDAKAPLEASRELLCCIFYLPAPVDSSARPCAPPCRPGSLESRWS